MASSSTSAAAAAATATAAAVRSSSPPSFSSSSSSSVVVLVLALLLLADEARSSSASSTAATAAAVAAAGQRRDRPARDRCNRTVEINDDVTTPPVTADNRGEPLLCLYRFRVNPQRLDWIISIRFYRFKVGHLANATFCHDGHVQIRDGAVSNAAAIDDADGQGFFCGEVDRPQTYVSETSDVTVVFYVRRFSEATYLSFTSRAEQKYELFARHGPNPQLYPDRRGRPVAGGTGCDRTFHDCRQGTCYVQSPAYPGVYPRNLRCRYHVSTSTGYVKLYIQNAEINVDGQRCEDVILCPNRPVTMSRCPYDYVSVYDGPTEDSPLIGSICGRGKVPYAITGSGNHLLLLFVSSPAGPFLNTGFHFSVGPLDQRVGHGASRVNGSCDATFPREAETPSAERRFHSLATWYPPHTTCSFAVWGWENEIIRLDFRNFRIRRPDSAILDERGCVETLTVYDAPFADEAHLVAMFCDSWSPVPPQQEFVSTGNAMFVQFRSEVGSYAGSSLDYLVQFDYFNAYTHGIPVPNTECDELFPSTGHSSGKFSSPLNSLLFSRQTRLVCSYGFYAAAFPYERVIVALYSVNFSRNPHQPECTDCATNQVDKVVVVNGDDQSECICGSKVQQQSHATPIRILSAGSSLDVKLFVEREHVVSRHQSSATTLLFQGTYEFLHGARCGPGVLEARHQGELAFPQDYDSGQAYSAGPDVALQSSLLRCVWSLLVHPNKSLFLRFDHLDLPGDCGTDRLEIKIPSKRDEYTDSSYVVICGDATSPSFEDLPVVTAAMLRDAGRVLVELRSTRADAAAFRLVWTELVPISEPTWANKAELRAEGCAFVCGGSNTCIPHELVCNGVRNCPSSGVNGKLQGGGGADEDYALCRQDGDGVNWLAIGLGAAGGGILATCFILIVHRCCRKYQDTDPGG